MTHQEDIGELIRRSVLDEGFVRASFSGAQAGRTPPWEKVQIRPVQLKGGRRLQFSYFDGRKDISKNHDAAHAARELEVLIDQGYRNMHLVTGVEAIQINISAKGKPMIGRSAVATVQEADLAHNRRKQVLLPEGRPDAFLSAVGIMNAAGAVKPGMFDKYRQINEFLKIVDQALRDHPIAERPITLVDFGCGNAYLTFAAYHYLTDLLGLPVRLIGVDLKSDLVERNNELARQLGWSEMSFEVGRIMEFQPPERVDIVVALHACDTATDEALAQAIRLGARLIFSAPCCHHHLQAQLDQLPTPSPFQLVTRHGILSERLGDLLTDALRAAILRILGYTSDVFQFVSSEHTAKNLMIRAVRSARPGDRRLIEEYTALKRFWQVTPYLEQLLEPDARALLPAAPLDEQGHDG